MVDSFRLYGWSAIRHVKKAAAKGARIYHFRAGFGGESLKVARRLGMFILCDHSIAHPATVDPLVRNLGDCQLEEEMTHLDPFWKYVMRDIEQADAVLVNSRFVDDTFRHAGFCRSPVHVMYLGVDNAFLAQVPQRETASGEFRMLFAGSFDRRKGAETLIDALGRLDSTPWHLEIAGPLDAGIVAQHRDFFADARVTCLGLLSRSDLAQAMSKADVFVFPSLAEGSARVIFEALACGCYVITTPNSGSIVEDGVHGSVVPAGDSSSLTRAAEHAFHNRDTIAAVGLQQCAACEREFTQRDYGNQLATLYKQFSGRDLVAIAISFLLTLHLVFANLRSTGKIDSSLRCQRSEECTQMKKVLIIGKNSFLAKQFVSRNCENFECTAISHDENIENVAIEEFSSVLNMAYDPRYFRVPYDAALDFDLQVAKRVAGKGPQFFMMSSRKVYGATAPFPTSESAPVEPTDQYGRNKAMTEQAVRTRAGHEMHDPPHRECIWIRARPAHLLRHRTFNLETGTPNSTGRKSFHFKRLSLRGRLRRDAWKNRRRVTSGHLQSGFRQGLSDWPNCSVVDRRLRRR